MDRRTRRLAQVQAWADCRPRYALRIGDRIIGFDLLTDPAFADLRNEIASDIRFERAINRGNRERRDAFAAQMLGASLEIAA